MNHLYVVVLVSVCIVDVGISHTLEQKINARYVANCTDVNKLVSDWLAEYEVNDTSLLNKDTTAQWNYATNLTDYNQNISTEADAQLSDFDKSAAAGAAKFNVNQITNDYNKRSIIKIRSLHSKLNHVDNVNLSTTISEMEKVYSNAKICSWDSSTAMANCSRLWDLPTDLTDIQAQSRDYDLLTYVWQVGGTSGRGKNENVDFPSLWYFQKAWRDAAGKPIRDDYEKMIELSNKGARAAGFNDVGAAWRDNYQWDVPDYNLREDVARLFQQILPMYEQLHTFVRKRLRQQYPNRFDSSAIPAHVLGNMWAQEWVTIYNWTAPYPEKSPIDVTDEMVKQGYTPLKMFKTADAFFQSLGMIGMNDEFYNCTMMVQPPDRDVVCHASAWDFYNSKKFCIKMCTHVNMDDLITIHHEMGHIEYFMQYANQSVQFKEGANNGFHEAIGDTQALSVSTPAHLKAIGLLPDYVYDDGQDINFLYRQALSKVAFLPFGYIIDKWRWDLFDGTVSKDKWNQHWWDLRFQYQGLVPPGPRSTDDFDPGAKYHVPANVAYIRYFISFVIQFEFYKSMCDAAGHTGPLHRCDFYNNKAAGEKLAQMLRLGQSKPWPEALKMVTGKDRYDASAILEYFKPLMDYLEKENAGECFGWGFDWEFKDDLPQPRCGREYPSEQERATNWLKHYNEEASVMYHDRVQAMWVNMLNQTQHNADAAAQAAAKSSQFDVAQGQIASKFDINQINDQVVVRQLGKINTVGIKLDHNDSVHFHSFVNEMTHLFDSGFICDPEYPDCAEGNDTSHRWYQDPELTNVMANSDDYDLLKYCWDGWREVTGVPMRPLYDEYVNLGNKGARNGGFQDMGDFWRDAYADPTFQQQIEHLWNTVLPLYENLHTYVRRSLSNKYPRKLNDSTIPAHLLGNMWAQEWNNLYNWTAPFPNVPTVDVTDAMIAQGWDVPKMFHVAEEFYQSIGLHTLNPSFWNISMIEKPANRTNVECYADSEDFFNGVDFAIDMCTKINMEDFITIHHEMGHIQYFMCYASQPIKFRDGANPGFHEAIGDTIALSVATPKHLHKIGLLSDHDYQPDNEQQQINFLYKQALSKIAFLPFGYLIDKYRWQVFDGTISQDDLNAGWWSMRYKYQGLSPPDSRSDETLFDAGSKFHVAADVPYIRYFVSFVIQFQFHEALCRKAGQTGPLAECDIYNSEAAGELLRNALNKGSSRPWEEVMTELTGSPTMQATALMDYFEPLTKYLKQVNDAAGDCYGWGYKWPEYVHLAQPRCP